ncbi:FAD-binding oxidoreductase [Pseudooceanicola sp. CBS1P-1]|uniref:FAD-binding protein n=1 Tax=Pseudooceanicola albus TaxID=2692189 RepID=A0A6L7G2T6_9RHOB|nr:MULTISPECIES: FAD-binding oxidoreductase [Pseudooceanicola]MBT9385232.1 FAD-binding oxidoreductase [Pseudooceanicola endophyticus]MXN18684.1 FAD-binding protein [Pseudooceanicola albus]
MTPDVIRALRQDLEGITLVREEALRTNSRDFYWFSPILREELDDKLPDLLAIPETREDLGRILSACARRGVPVTVRGGGTGNYGQSVPLEGGVLINMTRLRRVVSVEGGVGRFEAGCRLLNIDREIAPTGWELRLFPSTRRLATLGGYIAGGAGGVGSCTWGQLSDTGAILGVQLMTVEETPRLIELRDRDVLKVQHAYGLNGVITEVEMPLAPKYPWAEEILAFDSLTEAAAFAAQFTNTEAIVKKLVSVHHAGAVRYLEKLSGVVPAGKAIVIVMVNAAQAPATRAMAAAHGGASVYARDAAAAEAAAFENKGALPPLYEFCWNHTTWHAIKIDPALSYLQIRFPQGEEARLIALLERDFAEDLVLHFEFQRKFGKLMVSGLPIFRYRDRAALDGLLARLQAIGIELSNPHTCKLSAAGWKQVDAPQAEFKREADPLGLMNPGKLAAD